MGVLGLGRGFTLMLPTLRLDPRIELVACADPREAARAQFASEFGARAYASVEELCNDKDVEVVYVATPHQYHAAHTCLAAKKGKHILVEKPMALAVHECLAMIAAARKAGVQLIVGHSHSFDAPIQQARHIIASGGVGKVRMINAFYYTDFLYRPRRPEELITHEGGGVLFNQASHQIDVVCFLAGEKAQTVRAMTGAWDPTRPTEGAYSAMLAFEGGAFATLVYSGYAHFDSDEFRGWVGEGGQMKDPARHGDARRALAEATDKETEARMKAEGNYGGDAYKPNERVPAHHAHFGEVIVSCDRADLRPVPEGVMIHGDGERRLDKVPLREAPRAEVIDELVGAIFEGRAPLHSGEWALGTIEVCLAMLRSARTGGEVKLKNQIAIKNQLPPRAN
ncbi:MAG: Gfo/Idh/MocA family protein [Burkholderiales bacterium]